MRKSQALSLPSLNGLRAFEVVVRTQSVTLAAQELGVTQGAVSHLVRELEGWFGRELLHRKGRGLVPSALGQELAEQLAPAFSSLEQACQRVLHPEPEPLQLAAPSSFLARILVPGLEGLELAHPELKLRLRTDGQPADLKQRQVDALIVCDSRPWPTEFDERRLCPERIGPVCSPKLLPLSPRASRLGTETRPLAWQEWEKLRGQRSRRRVERNFDHLIPLLEALKAGLGLAVVPELLVQRELKNKELVAPFGFVESGSFFSLLRLAAREQEPSQLRLLEWLEDLLQGSQR